MSNENAIRDDNNVPTLLWNNSGDTKIIGTNTYWQLFTSDWKLDIVLWNVDWIEQFSKFGTNLDVDVLTTPEDVWNGWGLYTGFPTWSAETMEIFSSNILDNGVTPNTWARTVTITNLLDGDYNEMPDITVTLNWTTAVSLWAQTYLRSSRVVVKTAWSGWANAWTLTLRHTTTTANIFAQMPIWKNQTTIMAYTVPIWKKLLIDRIFLSMGRLSWAAWSANVNLRVRPFDWVFNAIKDASITNSSAYIYENDWYIVIDAKSDLTVRIEDVSDNNTFVSCEVTWLIINSN